jgi:hypothetical protein
LENDENDLNTIGWKKDDGDRWALVGDDLVVLEQGSGFPDSDDLQNVLNRHNVYSITEYYHNYMSKHGTIPGLELHLTFEIISKNIMDIRDNHTTLNAEHNYDNDIWIEPIKYLRRILREHPDILINMPYILNYNVSVENPEMKFLSKSLLDHIEMLLKKTPSSVTLWSQWIFWRNIEDLDRHIEPLIESISASPLSMAGTTPPGIVFDMYYDECKKAENWIKIINLLKSVWDREYTRIIEHRRENQHNNSGAIIQLGDKVGIPLIEAYLHEDKINEANDIFIAWMDCGKFSDVVKIVELAKTKGYEKLAREWETKVKK